METLDPFNTGRIDFNQFVIGMRKLTSEQGIFSGGNEQNEAENTFDEFDSLTNRGQFGQFTNGNNPVIVSLD